MRDDLDAIRRIRNKFGHRMHRYTFDEPEMVGWCKSLKLARMITDAIAEIFNTHRTIFLLGVTQLANELALKTLEVGQHQRSSPNDPELGHVIRG